MIFVVIIFFRREQNAPFVSCRAYQLFDILVYISRDLYRAKDKLKSFHFILFIYFCFRSLNSRKQTHNLAISSSPASSIDKLHIVCINILIKIN